MAHKQERESSWFASSALVQILKIQLQSHFISEMPLQNFYRHKMAHEQKSKSGWFASSALVSILQISSESFPTVMLSSSWLLSCTAPARRLARRYTDRYDPSNFAPIVAQHAKRRGKCSWERGYWRRDIPGSLTKETLTIEAPKNKDDPNAKP